jgi:membrane-bound lytic murein transglycosylase D
MVRRRILIIICIFCLLLSWQSRVLAQNNVLPLFQDDPIASTLDSIAQVKYFEKGLVKPVSPKTNKFQFTPDSIPRYDDATYESRLAKIDAESPFDLEYNDAVKSYIEMYAMRKRELVSRVMGMSQLYFPMIEQQLDKYDIPLEMKYLAIVESAMNSRVRSRAGAMGLWQFMYTTGKMYDLRVTSYVDERCDPYKATVAACEYLRFLYDMFGDWQLVLAAYNSGPGNVNKAIRRSGGKKTYWEIRPYLPRETQGYVPAFIAVNYVMRHTSEHNLYSSIPKRTFFEVDTVKIKQQITFEQISAVLNIPIEEVQFLNPEYKKGIIPYSADEPYTLCLPASKVGSFVTNEQAIYNYLKKGNPNSQDILAMQEVMKIHTVRKGEHLNTIANRYKCTIYDLKLWNNLKSNSVKPGKQLTVYINKISNDNTPAVKAPPQTVPVLKQEVPTAQVMQSSAVTQTAEGKFYTIGKGDTLWEIAKKNGTTIDEIKRLNNWGAKYVLLPGHKIKVG